MKTTGTQNTTTAKDLLWVAADAHDGRRINALADEALEQNLITEAEHTDLKVAARNIYRSRPGTASYRSAALVLQAWTSSN